VLHPNWFDPLSCMFVGAGATSRIRLGSDVLVAPHRNPIVLSQLLASADQLSGGRLILGLGIG
jgi:alkanesulfonate monooxygenase SsuD/methylene tetrahydromethanopterin reductase-like flavin-dependent oxidoreductase (luciferase family)